MKLLNKISIILLCIVYMAVVYYFTDSSLISVIFAGVFFMASCIRNMKNIKGKQYIITYVFLLIIDIVLLIYNCMHRDLPFTNVDWKNFDYFAKAALIKSNGNIFYIFANSIDAFTGCVAMIYRIFGKNVSQIYFYILPCAQILSNYMYKIIYKLTDDENKAKTGALIILIYPVNFIFSLSVLREIPIQMLVAISFYHFIMYYNEGNNKSLIKSLITIILACLMHSGMVGILIVYIYALLQRKIAGRVKLINISVLVITAIIFIGITFTPLGSKITNRFDSVSSGENLVNVMNTQNDYLEANTQYIDDVPDSIGGVILTIPYRYIMFILAPFPWQVYSLGTIISLLVDGVFRYIIVFLCCKVLFVERKKYDNKAKELILLIGMCVIITQLIFSFGTNNYGQAMRHRAKVLPLEIVMLVCYKRRARDETDVAD